MRFGEFATGDAEGVVLAHSVRFSGQSLPKGHRLTGEDIERLQAAGVASVIAARLDEGDLGEDVAARKLAEAIGSDHLTFSEAATGRVNVYSAVEGLFVVGRDVVDRVNRVDPGITLACLNDHVPVRPGDMVATFKIIPLAVAGSKVDEACAMLRAGTTFEVKPFQANAVSLVATELPSLKPAVMDKTARILAQRLAPSGSRLIGEDRVAHRADAVAAAIRNAALRAAAGPRMIVVFGASAVIDTHDVIPEAIRLAGGEVIQVGMPVDPGNLLVLGRIGDVPVVGAPGCARSPKENGFDWVLNRILAAEPITALDISGMGVGGLLMEIRSRPQLRDLQVADVKEIAVAAVVLAAGRARRMGEGGPHKLLAEFEGIPLVRRCALAALESSAASVSVVTGHRRHEIEGKLEGLDVALVHNPDFASGMASSLGAGFSSSEAMRADGILVLLADMPGVSSVDMDMLIAAFRRAGGHAIVRAVSRGKRGNPVILPRALRDAVLHLEGDIGARHIIESSGLPVVDVEIGDSAHLDVDTPEAVVAAGGTLKE